MGNHLFTEKIVKTGFTIYDYLIVFPAPLNGRAALDMPLCNKIVPAFPYEHVALRRSNSSPFQYQSANM